METQALPRKVALEGCELEIVCVLPHDHPLTGVAFPSWEDVVKHTNRGSSSLEEIDENIHNVTPNKLAMDLLIVEEQNISWIALKQGVRNHRVYIFFSERPAVKMPPEVAEAVNKLLKETYQVGKISKISNTIGPDLINVELFRPVPRKPKRFLGLNEEDEVEAFKFA